MQKKWRYKDYEIQEGLKPGSTTFRYFFVVSEKGMRKANYCVWIKDDALPRFDESGILTVLSCLKEKTGANGLSKKLTSRIFKIVR
jgi:hypothetical protein